MEREKIHKILDSVLDIVEKGEGKNGFPFVNFTVSNFPVSMEVYMMDSGFEKGKPIDGKYDFRIIGGESQRKYETCLRHLEELKAKSESFFQ